MTESLLNTFQFLDVHHDAVTLSMINEYFGNGSNSFVVIIGVRSKLCRRSKNSTRLSFAFRTKVTRIIVIPFFDGSGRGITCVPPDPTCRLINSVEWKDVIGRAGGWKPSAMANCDIAFSAIDISCR